MRRLRIGILGTRGIPNHYGGFEQFAQYLSAGLVRRGHDVYVYSSSNHPYRHDRWQDVHIIHCKDPEPQLGTFGQFIYDWNCIADARKRGFDVLLHLGYTSDSVWHHRWPKKTVNIVNMDGMEWKRSKYNRLTRVFLKWAESLAANNAAVLIADSPHMQQYIASTYGKPSFFIPYGAEVFTSADCSMLTHFKLLPYQYFLLVARMEPENNIEMTIQGYLNGRHPFPLVLIGDTKNPFGQYLRNTYHHPSVFFAGPVYEQAILNNLRYFSTRYFHGHSVGGTNPSLLEAMACGCNIVAHNNIFNNVILNGDADYFTSPDDVTGIITHTQNEIVSNKRRQNNIDKINTIYNLEKNIDDYEQMMFQAAIPESRAKKTFNLSPALYQTAEKSS